MVHTGQGKVSDFFLAQGQGFFLSQGQGNVMEFLTWSGNFDSLRNMHSTYGYSRFLKISVKKDRKNLIKNLIFIYIYITAYSLHIIF